MQGRSVNELSKGSHVNVDVIYVTEFIAMFGILLCIRDAIIHSVLSAKKSVKVPKFLQIGVK